jgi:hypothetical protein
MLGKDKVLCRTNSVQNKRITLIKQNYKGSHEMYNAHSYLGTDKIQTETYKNTCVGGIGYVLIYVSFTIVIRNPIIIRLGVWIMHLIWSIAYGDIQGI